MWDLKRKQNNMDCFCINLIFLFSFWLLGKFLVLKMSIFLQKLKNIDWKILVILWFFQLFYTYKRALCRPPSWLYPIIWQLTFSYRSSYNRVHWLNLSSVICSALYLVVMSRNIVWHRKHSEINIDEHDNVNAFVKKAIKTITFKDFVFL